MAGLALDSKYTGVLFGGGLAVWLVTVPAARVWLRRWQLWAGGVLAGAVFAPVLAWNAGHGWASFAKQGGRTGDWAPSQAARFVGELAASQLGLATPLVLLLCVAGIWHAARRWRDGPAWSLLACLTLVPVLVFVQHALGDRVQANWPAVLYPSACIAAGGLAGRWRRWWAPAAALGFVLAAPVYLQAAAAPFRLPRRLDLTLIRLGGWDTLARDAEAARQAQGAAFLAAEPYGIAAELAWHVPPGTIVLGTEPRWALFGFPRIVPSAPGLLVQTERRSTPPDPTPWASIEPAGRLVRSRGGVEAEAFRLYRVVPREGLPEARLPNRQEHPS